MLSSWQLLTVTILRVQKTKLWGPELSSVKGVTATARNIPLNKWRGWAKEVLPCPQLHTSSWLNLPRRWKARVLGNAVSCIRVVWRRGEENLWRCIGYPRKTLQHWRDGGSFFLQSSHNNWMIISNIPNEMDRLLLPKYNETPYVYYG